jgi:hypothetical protein
MRSGHPDLKSAIRQADWMHNFMLKNKYAKGGGVGRRTKNYKYIPNRMIQSAEVKKGRKVTEIAGKNILDGIYVRGKVKFDNGGSIDDKFSMSKLTRENGKFVEMVIAENVTVGEFEKMFNDKGYRKVSDTSLVGFYFVKPNGDTIQLVPSFHKRGEILQYENGGSIGSEEEEVRNNLVNGEISCEALQNILGCKPEYPVQVVGSLKLTKSFLRPYYTI